MSLWEKNSSGSATQKNFRFSTFDFQSPILSRNLLVDFRFLPFNFRFSILKIWFRFPRRLNARPKSARKTKWYFICHFWSLFFERMVLCNATGLNIEIQDSVIKRCNCVHSWPYRWCTWNNMVTEWEVLYAHILKQHYYFLRMPDGEVKIWSDFAIF